MERLLDVYKNNLILRDLDSLGMDYAKIEKQGNISINPFCYEDETPYRIYTAKQTFEKHVDLLQLSNLENSNYVFIKDFNRFMSNKNITVKKQFLLILLTVVF